MGHLYEDNSLWNTQPTESPSISIWIETCGLHLVLRTCAEKLNTILGSSFVVGEVHGAACLGSECVRAFRLAVTENRNDEETPNFFDCWDSCCKLVSLLGKGLTHSDVAVGNACSKGLVVAMSYDDRDAPILNERLYDSLAGTMESMTAAVKKYSSIDHADPTRSNSLIQAAGFMLAATTSGSGLPNLGPARLQCIEALFGVLGSHVYGKDDELSLTVGEALASCADAIGAGEWSSSSDFEWKEMHYDESYAFGLPPHKHIVYTTLRREILASNHSKKNSCAAVLLALVGRASRLTNIDSSNKHRTFVQELWSNVSLFQESFIKLLADPKSTHLSRECCCRGLAACRGLASAMNSFNNIDNSLPSQIESLNVSLLNAFGQTTNYGGSAMQETETQALQRRVESEGNSETNVQETQVGGAAGISEAALGAYREMASAALSLGRVDVLYSLMILSTNHPIWLMSTMRDRYSAKALLGEAEGSSEEIRVSLRPHLGKLIPKLLRACKDPNKQTREQMNNLWLAITGGGGESRSTVTQYLLPTIDVLIQDAGSKLWRTRAGACGALADVIVGRSWQDLGGGEIEIDDEGYATKATASIRLLRLWRITVRA
jgi:proteasome component ECM29